MSNKFLIILFLAAMAPVTAGTAFGQAHPSKHFLQPDKKTSGQSPYRGVPNFGKSIAVFGGSLSVNDESDAAKQMWADLLGAEVTTYGVGGAGFSSEQGYSLQRQVDTAAKHDIYILWASTNDFTNGRKPGTWKDYTRYDGFDENNLDSQCGGINYCIRKILEKNPEASIYFFTSLRFFSSDSGGNPFSVQTNRAGFTFSDYIEGQKACCAYYGIPVLDQFSIQGVNEFNVSEYYLEDSLHMNREGYLKIAPAQVSFIASH